ncbi:cupin domain-containing protein [Sphingobium subterraneum]|uniref:Quercetin dioxygenase-like cupin family protein n=1 Tax=Sphingobium subterraneum TaxID=627688 RepID=A0A841JA26_9SPHN|nr:cupin domain-containing protein [Sphingobium subterraneum]MBB6125355.1 quercetin dioxygenase-like cupin family protein [Sphingobium subterraneum]
MRRVVTGLNEQGKAAVLYDGKPQSVLFTSDARVGKLKIEAVPDFVSPVPAGNACFAELWETDGLPPYNMPDPLDRSRGFTLEPPGTGFRFRYFEWGPDLDSSTMHATDTFDINYVIEGEVELLLEEEQSVTLRAGDSVIIPGILHGWRAGPAGVRMINFMQKQAPGTAPTADH